MKYFVMGPTYIVRLDPGDRIIASLEALCDRDRIGTAAFEGIGVVAEAEIGHYDTGSGDFATINIHEPCEIVSLQGNVTTRDGKPFVHAHISLAGREFGVRGGHLREAVVSATAEIVLTRYFEAIGRRKDAATGVEMLDLKPGEA